MKKKSTLWNFIWGSLLLFPLVLQAQEVYQLPNPDFELWEKGIKLDGTVSSYDEPVGWNSFGTATGGYISFTNHSVSKGEENNNRFAIVTSSEVSVVFLKVKANGNMTTGIVKAGGTSATHKENHNYTVAPNATDAGANNFRQVFTGRPDALKAKIKYIPMEAKNEAEKEMYQAEVSAWIHTNEKFQVPYETKIEEKAVASAVINPQYDNAREWTEFAQAFDYSVGNAENQPAYVLLNVGTNKTPGQGSENDSLFIDDVYFVYYSSLADLRVNGQSITGFNEEQKDYVVSGPAPELAQIEAITKSPWATVEPISQVSSGTQTTFTLVVKGNDFSASGNQTTYTLTYQSASEATDVSAITGNYIGTLQVFLDEEPIVSQTEVLLTDDGNQQIGLHLKDFAIELGGDVLPLGDIDIPNIPVQKEGEKHLFTSQTIPLSFLGGMIEADVTATGSVEHNLLQVAINVLWIVDEQTSIPIPVVFTGNKVNSGITCQSASKPANITVAGNEITVQEFEGKVNVYNTMGVQVLSTTISQYGEFTLDKGLYIIQAGNTSKKVYVY